MKVLHLANLLSPQGSGGMKLIVALVSQLRKRHGIETILAAGDIASAPELTEQLRSSGIPLINCSVPAFRASPVGASRALLRLLLHPHAQGLSLVHTHAHAQMPAALARLKSAGLVITTHCVASRFAPLPKPIGAISSWLYRRAYAHAARVVAISDYVKRDLERSLEGRAAHIQVIHNGIDLDVFSPGIPGELHPVLDQLRRSGRVLLGVVGRISADKRPEDILPLAQASAADIPGLAFILVGTGNAETAIRSRIRDLHLEDRVFLIGHQPDMADIYRQLDALIHMTPDEAFGLVLVEAMACGLPVAGVAGSAIHEIVIDGETGYICPQGAPERWHAAFRSLEDPAMRKRLGTAGRARAVALFGLGRMVDEYAALYQSVACESRP